MKNWLVAMTIGVTLAACAPPPKPLPSGSGGQGAADVVVSDGGGGNGGQDAKSCPTCPAGQVCGLDGTCVCDKAKECAGKACGKGACGGDCPDTCKAPRVCAAASGACECPATNPQCLPVCKLDGTVKLPCRL